VNLDLQVSVGEHRFVLRTSDTFTVGRWEGCSVTLDTADHGISRIAVTIGFEHGTWWVRNNSQRRELRIVDALGLTSLLPVARTGAPAPKRAVDPAGMRVVVTGDIFSHEIRLTPADPELHSTTAGVASAQTETVEYVLKLTIARRSALVAMMSGYLQPHPRYHPEPLTYPDAAKMLGLSTATVRKRIEAVRAQLVKHGVPGLEVPDARRPLAEWLLAHRHIGPADLAWLKERLYKRDARNPPPP
jgi:hypothetical protein